MNGVLLRSLPYPESERLVVVGVTRADLGGQLNPMSLPDIVDIEADADALTTLVGYSSGTATLTETGDPTIVQVGMVETGLLSAFHVSPPLGRDILREESGASAATVVVISHSFWQQRFRSSQEVLGKTVRLDGAAYEIVGVAPPGFEFPTGIQIWYPRQWNLEGCGRGCHAWRTIGRLGPGTTVAAALGEIDAIAARLSDAYPRSNSKKAFTVRTLRADMIGDVRIRLWLLLGAELAVLLIACGNVANLLLARAEARQGEAAVRAVLGASPRRLVGTMLAETAVLAVIGGGFGLLLAGGGVPLVRRLAAGTVPRLEMVTIDVRVLLFTIVVVGGVTLLFGMSPALRASRMALSRDVQRSGRGGDTGSKRGRLRWALTVTQTAMAFVLLVGTGLMLRAFASMFALDPGYETRRILRFDLNPPRAAYPDLESVRSFYRALEGRLRDLAGVEAVGSAYGAPLGPNQTSAGVRVDGRPDPEPGHETSALGRAVSPGYMETLRIPVVRGRPLSSTDDLDERPVALVNETFVRENFPGTDPIGQRIRTTLDFGYGSPTWEIVGVTADVRDQSLTREPIADICVPHGQFGPASLSVGIRTSVPASGLISAVRSEVHRLNSEIPLQNIETVADVLSQQLAPTRFLLAMVGAFAGLALLLAAIGLYGVTTYLVSQRLPEIGLRVALGARPRGIVWLRLRAALAPTISGLVIGLGVAVAGGRIATTTLYRVTPRDPLTLAVAPVVLIMVAVLAVIGPARRASRRDPLGLLRME